MTHPTAPVRSVEQRMIALQRANDIRHERHLFKQRLKTSPHPMSSAQEAIALLQDFPAEFETMKIGELLIAVRHIGRVKARAILGRVRISPSKTVGGLSDRQRTELCEHLAGHGLTSTIRPFASVMR